jgi:hypothetical protein
VSRGKAGRAPRIARIRAALRIGAALRLGAACAAAALWSAGAMSAWAYQPLVNFQLQCMGCHLADGSGEAGRVPSVRRSLVRFSQLAEGRQYVIRVPGVAQSPLSDEETAALLNWMARNLSDLALPPDFVDYSAAEIRRWRGQPLAEVSAMRARLMSVTAAPRNPDSHARAGSSSDE